MKVYQAELVVPTEGRGMYDVTARVQRVVTESGVSTGLCTVFIQHTSASLVIQENADITVRRDLADFMDRVAPEGARYHHDTEGPDDMPSHLRATLTRTSEVVPVTRGQLALGTWQGIYVWEHRRIAHRRTLVVHVTGT